MSAEAPAITPQAAVITPENTHPLRAVFNLLTSLKLCVVILALCALGVFLGTIAQVNEGLYEAQERWFKSWFVLRQAGDPWWVLFYPGGYLLGVLLIINLTGAHLRRFKYPPGGFWLMMVHYAAVAAGLYYVTAVTLWTPMIFFLAITGVLVLDMLLCSPGPGFKHFRATGKKIGVDLVHIGIVVLLVGQLATDMFASETHMAFREGQTMHYSESRFDSELVLTRDIPNDPDNEEVVSIPQALMVESDKIVDAEHKHAKLPFSVRLRTWYPNSELVSLDTALKQEGLLRQALATLESRYASAESLAAEARRAVETPGRLPVWKKALTDLGIVPGQDLVADVEKVAQQPDKAAALLGNVKAGFRTEMINRFKLEDPNSRYAAEHIERDPESKEAPPAPQASSEVAQRYRVVPLKVGRDMESRNIPGGVVELTGTAGSIGTWIVSPHLREQTIDYGGTKWRLALRIERTYYPFSVTLLQTTNEVYPGTEIPKDFRSRLRLDYPAKKEQRETEVFMNAPLRYEGLTFFQYQMGKDELDRSRGTSSLQVVKNPSWFSPYFGCVLVGYGMLRHFLLHLLRFIRKRSHS
jgi:hypothetical protein